MSGQRPFSKMTKLTWHAFVSLGTRLDASEKKPATVPSPLIAGSVLPWFACAPALSMLTRWVICPTRSRTKTSGQVPGEVNWIVTNVQVFVSPSTRLAALESKVTKRPSSLDAERGRHAAEAGPGPSTGGGSRRTKTVHGQSP